MGKSTKKEPRQNMAASEVLTISNDGPPASGPYVVFSSVWVSGGLLKADKGTGPTSRNDVYVVFSFADSGVVYTAKSEVHHNVDNDTSTHLDDSYILAIPETLIYPFTVKVAVMDHDNKGKDDELGDAAVEITDHEGVASNLDLSTKGSLGCSWTVHNLEEEVHYEYVPPEAVAPRQYIPISATSEEAKYLEQRIWPTLLPALERLLSAVQHHMSPQNLAMMKKSFPEGLARVSRPELAENFDPVAWLAQYLEWYNPNVEPKFSRHTAAVTIQCCFKQYQARKILEDLKTKAAAKEAAQELSNLRDSSATIIQAAYRGHCVRQSLRLGRTADFQLINRVVVEH